MLQLEVSNSLLLYTLACCRSYFADFCLKEEVLSLSYGQKPPPIIAVGGAKFLRFVALSLVFLEILALIRNRCFKFVMVRLMYSIVNNSRCQPNDVTIQDTNPVQIVHDSQNC